MIDREKVIKGLECCTTAGFGCIENKECPYSTQRYGSHCVDSMLRDAIALLKAQEPRILTKKDMEDTEPRTVVWCEQRDEIRTYMIPMIKYDDGMFECRFLGASSEAADLANIRFWSARPSDQLREATPW